MNHPTIESFLASQLQSFTRKFSTTNCTVEFVTRLWNNGMPKYFPKSKTWWNRDLLLILSHLACLTPLEKKIFIFLVFTRWSEKEQNLRKMFFKGYAMLIICFSKNYQIVSKKINEIKGGLERDNLIGDHCLISMVDWILWPSHCIHKTNK